MSQVGWYIMILLAMKVKKKKIEIQDTNLHCGNSMMYGE